MFLIVIQLKPQKLPKQLIYSVLLQLKEQICGLTKPEEYQWDIKELLIRNYLLWPWKYAYQCAWLTFYLLIMELGQDLWFIIISVFQHFRLPYWFWLMMKQENGCLFGLKEEESLTRNLDGSWEIAAGESKFVIVKLFITFNVNINIVSLFTWHFINCFI